MYPNLLKPIQIGTRTLRNRVFVSAHVPGFAENGRPGERYIQYHQRRAAGGAVGLVMLYEIYVQARRRLKPQQGGATP